MQKLQGISEEEKRLKMSKIIKDKSTIYQRTEITKRNFYLQLFRTYCELPYKETIASFVKVFNDVFVKEKPQVCQKYFLTEVNIIELDMAMRNENGMTVGFRWNFCSGTTKETNYLNSAYVRTFLHTTLRAIKTEEKEQILNFSPRRKDDKNIVERGDL
jgi:hypothetical protein